VPDVRPSYQGCVERLGERDVGRVASGNVLQKIPDASEERDVNALSRALDPVPNRLGVRIGVQEDRTHGGGVQDDQRLLAETARVVGVSHPADRDLRWLV
jgi:hypothetical protein